MCVFFFDLHKAYEPEADLDSQRSFNKMSSNRVQLSSSPNQDLYESSSLILIRFVFDFTLLLLHFDLSSDSAPLNFLAA
ncbi:unnamed protein product [Lathyrus oleraceus]